jgi:predicted LPLAT superfamily acyltransferase
MLGGVHVISTTDPLAAGAAIIGALRKGETVAMRADRTLSGRGIPVTFFGERVVLPAGPFVAAALTGVPVIDVHTIRTAARRYECRISPARQYGENEPGTRDERVGRAAQDFATHLETLLRAYPYQWSNFYDFWHEQASEAAQQNP